MGAAMKNDAILRSGHPEDLSRLKALWQDVFGDPPEVIDAFLSFSGAPKTVMLMEEDGDIASAIYTLPMEGLYFPNGTIHPISLTYALATRPKFRGRGYGKQVMNAAIQKSFSEGFLYSAQWPAKDWLFDHYRKTANYLDCFAVRESQVPSPDTYSGTGWIREASAAAYNNFRNNFLQRRKSFFIMFGDTAITLQKKLSACSGGGCYLFGADAVWGCASCEIAGDGTVLVKELLCPEEKLKEALSLLATVHPAKSYCVRTPADLGYALHGRLRYCGQLQNRGGNSNFLACKPGYYGLAFD